MSTAGEDKGATSSPATRHVHKVAVHASASQQAQTSPGAARELVQDGVIKLQDGGSSFVHRCRSSLVPPQPPPLWHGALGVALLAVLLSVCAAAPLLLPHAFLVMAAVALPWRVVDFWARGYVFFLVDLCYFVNVAVMLLLILEPVGLEASSRGAAMWRGLHASGYVLAEGPVAAALIAWRCAWVLDAPDKTISVLVHLLPGLALAAQRHLPAAEHARSSSTLLGGLVSPFLTPVPGQRLVQELHLGLRALSLQLSQAAQRQPRHWWWRSKHVRWGWDSLSSSCPPGADGQVHPCCGWRGWALWLVAAPLAFYLVWQLLYFLVVQVAFRPVIKSRGYDTSYNCLARRARKREQQLFEKLRMVSSGSLSDLSSALPPTARDPMGNAGSLASGCRKSGRGAVSSLVMRGSVGRRVAAYGLVHLCFTLVTMVLAIATYHCASATMAWQAVKFVLPLAWGIQDMCTERLQWWRHVQQQRKPADKRE